jgi:hypothetical protein
VAEACLQRFEVGVNVGQQRDQQRPAPLANCGGDGNRRAARGAAVR